MNTAHPSRRERDVKPASSSIEVVALNELNNKALIAALSYWNGLRGERAFPAREEITPRGMVRFLRHVVLMRVVDGGQDYEYRIAGEAFVNAFGVNFKGRLLSEVEADDPDYGQATRAIYECVRNLGEPFALRGTIAATADARFSHHETVFLPLGSNGVVDHLLVVSAFLLRPTDTIQMPVKALLPASWQNVVAARAKAAD